MNGGEGETIGVKRMEKHAAVLEDRSRLSAARIAKIQARSGRFTCSAAPCAERVHEPGKRRELRFHKPFEAIFLLVEKGLPGQASI